MSLFHNFKVDGKKEFLCLSVRENGTQTLLVMRNYLIETFVIRQEAIWGDLALTAT